MTNHSRFRYFLTLVDVRSRTVWIYLMQLKFEVSVLIKRFYNLIETQFGKRVKLFRSDNGSEFVSANLKQFFSNSSIIHQTTQQNGIVERNIDTC